MDPITASSAGYIIRPILLPCSAQH